MKWLRRILFILLITIISLLVLLVIFISPIAKWAIERYSVEYTGRQIKMDKLRINLFTGSVSSKGLKIYEAKSSKLFFQCAELYADIEEHKLFSSTYELTEIRLDNPTLNVIEKGKRFNFSDLIDRFSSKKPSTLKDNKPVKWEIKKADVNNAAIVYENSSPHNIITIKRCNIHIPGISWNNKVYSINTDFSFASGGDVKGKISFDKNSWMYGINADIKRFDVKPFFIYLKDYLKVNQLNGLLSTHLNISGNMHNATAVAASGNITVEDFSIIDNVDDKLTAVDKMSIDIDTLNTEKNMYHFATIQMIRPYLKLEMYKEGYNFDRLSSSPVAMDTSTTTYSNIFTMIADYVQNIVSNYVISSYNADKFVIEGGQFRFVDYTLYDKFRYSFDSLDLLSDRLSSNSTKIHFDASAILNRSGKLKGFMDINPQNFKDFAIDCSVKDLSISDFNPYSKYYVATPFLKGTIDYTNKTTVVKRQLTSDNILDVQQIIAGKKDKTNKPQYNMPVRLAVALLKDVHGNIHLKIPVTGSLDDPKFKWGKIVWQVLGNLVTKAAAAPFKLLAHVFGGKEEDYKEVDFDYLQTTVSDNQQKQLDQLAKTLKDKPGIKLELVQVSRKHDEMEALAIHLAKKNYLNIADSTAEQQRQINSFNINDSAFIAYVNKQLQTNSNLESIQEKCIRLVGKDALKEKVEAIMQQRIDAITNYLLQKEIPKEKVLVHNSTVPNDPNVGNAPKFVINVAEGEDATIPKQE
ncbi:DUF748 domain-containing protein [Ferruginibacter albus]|uniref:DUF748 domain-containing protein n=1 Tax=Ferruginibacter albus TaxID=2875540 RepID=UPI001CC6A416|nr:DUF748 domain-containing protein [Ferruginibacter albus]UAY50776.1 DUF748 domain-containing protein [Ferruginibacter albus]